MPSRRIPRLAVPGWHAISRYGPGQPRESITLEKNIGFSNHASNGAGIMPNTSRSTPYFPQPPFPLARFVPSSYFTSQIKKKIPSISSPGLFVTRIWRGSYAILLSTDKTPTISRNIYSKLMYYLVVPELKLILAWSPKCACTTAKSAVIEALGHDIVGNIHDDMLTNSNLQSGRYGVIDFRSYQPSKHGEIKTFNKICIIRDPYSRYISAIRQRAPALIKKNNFRGMTAGDYLDYLEANNFGEDHHFHPQTRHLRKFMFDRVLDISEMKVLFEILGLEYSGSKKFGGHSTGYGEECPMQATTILDLIKGSSFPRSIHSWLSEENITKLRMLYADDFEFAQAHGRNYELPY